MISTRAGTAAIAFTIIGAAGFLIMPVVLGAAVVELDLSEAEVGMLGSMLMVGAVVSAVSALFWVRSIDWRLAARIGLVTQGTGLFLAAQADSFTIAGVAMLLASLGGGAVYSLALTVLSDHEKSERMFGYSIAGQVSFQVVGLVLLGLFTVPGGFDKLMLALAALVGAGLLLTPWLPGRGEVGPAVTVAAVFKQGNATLALFACLFFFLNVGSVWAYIERIGSNAGFAADQLGTGLAIGVSVGVIGALTASWQSERWGYVMPLVSGTVGTVVAVALVQAGIGFTLFVLGVAIYNFFWNYSLAYQYAVVAGADGSGRCVAVAPAFHAAGATVGPALAAALLTPGSFIAVNVLAAASVVVSLLLFLPAARGQTSEVQT